MALFTIPESVVDSKDSHVTMFVQGKRYQIKRGEEVEVPLYLKELYNEHVKFKKDACSFTEQDKKMCQLDLSTSI